MGGVAGRYVYVVCSDGHDYFAEMAAVSAATLRIVSPHARIVVLTDAQTAAQDTPGVNSLRGSADDFLAIDCEGDTPVIRSRVLKTGMRDLLSGPILYLDSDTIVMKSPDAIWQIECDVAASPDLSVDGRPYSAAAAQPEIRAKLGWALKPRLYLNAGVICFADTPGARAACQHYRASWLEYRDVIRQPSEQLSFNRAVDLSGARLAVLHSSYNAQISTNAFSLRGAIIVHYFAGNFEAGVKTIAHQVGKRLRQEHSMDGAALRAAIASGNPWTHIDSYSKAVAAGRYWSIGRVAWRRLRKKLG